MFALDTTLLLVAAGFVDSIAGGGSLIALPSLLLAGFAPAAALGTTARRR